MSAICIAIYAVCVVCHGYTRVDMTVVIIDNVPYARTTAANPNGGMPVDLPFMAIANFFISVAK